MADSLQLIALNLSSIANELAEYKKSLQLILRELKKKYRNDFETPLTKTYTSGAIASMIIIKACGFRDEVNNHYSKHHRNTQTPEIKVAIKELNAFMISKKIPEFRNYVLAHNNRKSDKILFWDEIISMRPLYEPEDYYKLIECCRTVAILISSLPQEL